MKRFFAALLIMLLPLSAFAEDNLVYWIYPNGGRYYHLDQNCPVVNPKYLPLQVSMTKEELEQPANSFYLPCNICVDESHVASVPEEIKETGTPTEEPAWEMIIDPKYSEYTLKDRYVEERPVWIDEHNMLAKAGWNPEGYSTASKYLQWYRDGKLIICGILAIFCMLISVENAENHVDGKALLEEILSSYSAENVVLSHQVQIVHSAVNFREAPEGKVISSLDGGEILECLDEEQYKGALWYHARSERYGDGYVISTYAKPIWNNQNYWPLSEPEDTIPLQGLCLAAMSFR